MEFRSRVELGGVTAVAGGANIQVQLVRVVEELTSTGVTELSRTPWRGTIDRDLPEEGAPEGGWAPPMARLDHLLGRLPEGWPALSDDDLAHVRAMARAAWGEERRGDAGA